MSEQGDSPVTSRLLFSRRHAIMGGMMLATGVAANLRLPQDRYPAIKGDKLKSWIPDRFGDWQRVDSNDVILPPEDALRDRLYDNLITRVYREADGEEVMILLAYNNRQDGMLQVHRPEVCYPVGGFTLTDTQPTQLEVGGEVIPSSQFTASSVRRTEHVLYFTRVGSGFPRSWSQQRVEVMRANLAGYVPDGLMFRASSLSLDGKEANKIMRIFSDALYQASSPEFQRLLMGKSKGEM